MSHRERAETTVKLQLQGKNRKREREREREARQSSAGCRQESGEVHTPEGLARDQRRERTTRVNILTHRKRIEKNDHRKGTKTAAAVDVNTGTKGRRQERPGE